MVIDTNKLEQHVYKYFEDRRKVYPCHVNRASSLGHPCKRFLVFQRTRWKDALLHDTELEIIFNEGNVHEEAVLQTLKDCGFDITQQQRGYFEAPQKISGHLDTFISHPVLIEKPVPAEIKGLSANNWQSIKSYEDMVNNKQWYIRKYVPQLQVYMYLTENEDGLFILKNKQTGQLKFIHVTLDYDLVEGLIKKAEDINESVDSNLTPDGIDDMSICKGCQFRHVCFKDQDWGEGLIYFDDETLSRKISQMLDQEMKLSDFKNLKDEVGDSIKNKVAKERPNDDKVDIIIGDYSCRVTKVSPKGKNSYYKINGVERL